MRTVKRDSTVIIIKVGTAAEDEGSLAKANPIAAMGSEVRSASISGIIGHQYLERGPVTKAYWTLHCKVYIVCLPIVQIVS
jgi:hypothetical protein